jgi:hypothetical protein
VVYGESKLSLGYGREIALVKMHAFIFVNDWVLLYAGRMTMEVTVWQYSLLTSHIGMILL